ncbi:MAG: FecR family protein [Spirochaetes bacterium]|nr:FecR family protein [Spirochaetota bacterium]
MKRNILAGLVLAAFVVCGTAHGQAPQAYAEIEYIDGDDLSVVRKGLAVSTGDPLGFRLFQGDQIQTGKGTFLEIRIYPRKDMLKLSENTTFVIQKLVPGGENSFQLIYGRVRAKVDKLSGKEEFAVRSTTTAAGVRGTDFGYDVIAARNAKTATGEPLSRVYCFDGVVEVTTFVTPPSARPDEKLEPVPQTYMLAAGEMVTVEKVETRVEATKTSIPEDVKAFWQEREFKSGAETGESGLSEKTEAAELPAVPVVPAAEAQASSAPSLDLSEYAIVMTTMRKKNTMILLGTLLASTGMALQGTGAFLYYTDNPGLGLNFFAAGAMITGVSIPVFINGYFIDPKLEKR